MSTVIFSIVNIGVVAITYKAITKKIKRESLKIQGDIATMSTKLVFDYKTLEHKLEKVECNTRNENIRKVVVGEISKEVTKLAFTPLTFKTL